MNVFKHAGRFLLGSLAVIVLAGAVPGVLPIKNNVSVVQAAKAKISSKKLTLIKGQTAQLKVTGIKGKIKWSSNKKAIASVSPKGKVNAKKSGKAIIKAQIGKKKFQCSVYVETPKLNRTSLSLKLGNSFNLRLLSTKQKIKWSSSDFSIVTVNNKGKIYAKKAGNATVVARVSNKKYTCKINVIGNPTPVPEPVPTPKPEPTPNPNPIPPVVHVDKVMLNKTEICLNKGDSETLFANIFPSNATYKNVSWTSTNPNVAEVNDGGMIIGKTTGTSIIAATVDNKIATCSVTVKEINSLSEEMAAYGLKLLDNILVDPYSIVIHDLYSDQGNTSGDPFVVLEYSAANSLGGRVRSYMTIRLADSPAEFLFYSIEYKNQFILCKISKYEPSNIDRVETLDKDKITSMSKDIGSIKYYTPK